MSSIPLIAAARHGRAFPALIVLLFASSPALYSQRPIRDQDILQYLNQTITWYHDISAVVQSPADSRQLVYADSLRQSSSEVARLAFDFARLQTSIPAASTPENLTPEGTRSRTLAQSAAAAEQRAEQARLEIEQLNRQLQTSTGASRTRLLALRDEVTSEANFAKARVDALHTLIGFLSTPDEGGLAARVRELERSAPEIASAGQKSPGESVPGVRSAAPPEFHAESSGIVGLTTDVITVTQRMGRLDSLLRETDALRQTSERLREPLRNALRQVIRRGDTVSQTPESSDAAILTAQRTELDALLARFKQLSASSSPLNEQSAQIAATRGRIIEWRNSLDESYRRALRYLLLRVGMLAVALVFIIALSHFWRRATIRYVQDIRRRRQFLLLRRIVVGCTIVLLIVLSFVTEFGSLATFAGFSAAGIAVAMQSVILSVVAYFFLVGRWGVRVGDRVTISGITGEVADVGLFRLYLMELGGSDLDLKPTGRIVVFPNSVFFQPAALFKQLPGIDYVWRTIYLKLSGTTDYKALEKRLLEAVESIYAEYADVVAKQHNTAQSSLNVHTAAPRPETRVRFVDSGLLITVRYPVEIRRAAEIDDRITRKVIQQVEADPHSMLSAGGSMKIELKAG